MPERCVFGGCDNVREKGKISLFKWPEDEVLSSRWTRFVKLQRYRINLISSVGAACTVDRQTNTGSITILV